METIIVKLEGERKRLDSYLADEKRDISRTMLKKLIDDGNILVNGKKQKSSYKVQNNDEIQISKPEAKGINLKEIKNTTYKSKNKKETQKDKEKNL